MKTAKILSALAVSALLISPSFAADTPLPAGKPAGTRESALLGFSALTVAFVGGFTGLLIAAGSGAFSSKPVAAAVTTSTTGTGA
jgi:hypothetical protein